MQSAAAKIRDFEPDEPVLFDDLVSSAEGYPMASVTGEPPAGAKTGTTPKIEKLDPAGITDSLSLSEGEYYPLPEREKSLVPAIFEDILSHFWVYVLILVLSVMALYKIYQVQDTRTLTAALNEAVARNDNLNNEWLELLALKQSLAERTEVRKLAREKLGMIQPAPEAEIVIRLERR